MVSLPTLLPVPTQAHALDATFPTILPLVQPDRLATSFGRVCVAAPPASVPNGLLLSFDPDTFHYSFNRFHQPDVSEVVLFSFDDFQALLELHDTLLQVVVVDDMAIPILQTFLTGS